MSDRDHMKNIHLLDRFDVFVCYLFRYEDVYYPEDGMDHTQEYIKVCGYCPENFPWLYNPEGK